MHMESTSGILTSLFFAAGCGAGQPTVLSDDLGMPTADSEAEASSAASTTAADPGVVEQFASAKLAGIDESFGGSCRADLTGQLDCANHTFPGTLNGTYEFALDAGSITAILQ
jgi:hypothetical protein